MTNGFKATLSGWTNISESSITFPVISEKWDIRPALKFLEHYGLAAPINNNLYNGLLLALSHESYIYEHHAETANIISGLTTALDSLGGRFLARSAAVYFYRKRNFSRPGPLSELIASTTSIASQWASSQEWIKQCAALSKGLHREALPRSLPGRLLRQVLGALCLAGRYDISVRLIGEMLVTSADKLGNSLANPRTVLEQRLRSTNLDTCVDKVGPDHAPRFTATLTDSQGRRSRGEGATKKEALGVASANFLQQYFPDTEANIQEGGPLTNPLMMKGPGFRQHISCVDQIRELFRLSVNSSPLLSQALIHSSWPSENPAVIARTHQRDNQVLGLVGSWVLAYEYALRVIYNMWANLPDQFGLPTLERETYERGFYYANLERGLLLGVGQEKLGMTSEIAANAFQAIMAAVYLSKKEPASLLEDWPPQLSQLLDIVIPSTPRSDDSVTLLQEICSASQLTADYSFEVSGPKHKELFQAILTLSSKAIVRQIKVVSDKIPGGKAAAKRQAATIVLKMLDALAKPDSIASLARGQSGDGDIAVFMLAHLRAVVPRTEPLIRRWMKDTLFGAHLAGNPAALIEWAHQADRLLPRPRSVRPSALTRLFQTAAAISADEVSPTRQELVNILNWLNGLDGPSQIEERQVSRLAQLSDLYRALASKESDTDLPSLIDDWDVLYKGRIRVTAAVPSVLLDSPQRAAIDAIVSLLLKYGRSVEINIGVDRPLHIKLASDMHPPTEEFVATCVMWSAASPLLAISPIEGGADAALTIINAKADSGTVTRSVATAFLQSPEPYSGAVADVLHDLKNQLIAAKQALSMPAPNRTAQLTQQAAASSHLDRAIAIGRGLSALTSLLGPPNGGVTELGTFMRQYATALLSRLPPTISLTVPRSASEPVATGLDELSLTAILDNLIKNAVEAMPNGGTVKLNWTSDQQEAVIELEDDGPGLPAQVVRALETGGRVRSTKASGNGLGLLSVQKLLRRAGGELGVASSPSGARWLLSIPLAQAAEGRDAP